MAKPYIRLILCCCLIQLLASESSLEIFTEAIKQFRLKSETYLADYRPKLKALKLIKAEAEEVVEFIKKKKTIDKSVFNEAWKNLLQAEQKHKTMQNYVSQLNGVNLHIVRYFEGANRSNADSVILALKRAAKTCADHNQLSEIIQNSGEAILDKFKGLTNSVTQPLFNHCQSKPGYLYYVNLLSLAFIEKEIKATCEPLEQIFVEISKQNVNLEPLYYSYENTWNKEVSSVVNQCLIIQKIYHNLHDSKKTTKILIRKYSDAMQGDYKFKKNQFYLIKHQSLNKYEPVETYHRAIKSLDEARTMKVYLLRNHIAILQGENFILTENCIALWASLRLTMIYATSKHLSKTDEMRRALGIMETISQGLELRLKRDSLLGSSTLSPFSDYDAADFNDAFKWMFKILESPSER